MHKHCGLVINGYEWVWFADGIHAFQKEITPRKLWALIECSEEQLYNGDIEFLTQHEITIGKELKKKIKTNYNKLNK